MRNQYTNGACGSEERGHGRVVLRKFDLDITRTFYSDTQRKVQQFFFKKKKLFRDQHHFKNERETLNLNLKLENL